MSWTKWHEKQPDVVRLLVNSLRKKRLPHAYLFEGEKGTGKRAIAETLVKAIYCKAPNDVEPCHQCIDCRRIASGNHPDVHIVSPDGQSIKIGQIRQLKKEFSYLGVESTRKAYLIEQAERMTTQASNSLLKLLEEPNQETIAILLTENGKKMLPTIASRCQSVAFRPPPIRTLRSRLDHPLAFFAATVTNDDESGKKMAEDEWFAQARKIVIQLTEEMMGRPDRVLLLIQEKWIPHFKAKEEMDIGLHLLLLWFRDLLSVKVRQLDQVVYSDQLQQLERYARRFKTVQIGTHLETIMEARKRLNANVNPQLVIEQAVLTIQEG